MSKKRPNECCNNKDNIIIVTDPKVPEMEIEKCQVCGCRHFRLIVEKANFKMLQEVS